MSVKVKRSGEPMETTLMKRIRAAAAAIGPVIVGMIQRRTAKGDSWKGGRLADYKRSYKEALAEGGESAKVDLTLTGSYLADIKVLKETFGQDKASLLIGPGTGTSPQVTPSNGHMQQTGERSPPHNILGGYLEYGTPKMRARPHLGLTEAERKRIAALIGKVLKGG